MVMPMPRTLDEQTEIVQVLDGIDRKIDLHRRKRGVLNQLFNSLLNKLMTGEVSVDDLSLTALPGADERAA
jgi:type I restriction enzyme S subunit